MRLLHSMQFNLLVSLVAIAVVTSQSVDTLMAALVNFDLGALVHVAV